ncbi:ATP-binding cassette domain-containing protein [Bordetella sp. 02P26C-1]|uniref:ATP-binding cassette domain-containing protein n=1 Tax=Bordetella sp. 02P26C-1 TaxID=2683195 RepID=UPI0013531640|nr:ATP-binding cassette domain-containing protein [Bordetella sp. 02P26C-1]
MHTSAHDGLLRVQGLNAGYGKIQILHDIDMVVGPGEIVALLGPNGAGKSTLMRALSGLLPWMSGDVWFDGKSLRGSTPRDAAQAGLVHVIEGHHVFTQLSVHDNLALAGYDIGGSERQARIRDALAFFPEIAAKIKERAGALSGGQQQMLVVAQGLVKRPRLLILDEPSAGLSPVLVDRVFEVAARLRDSGTSVLLVEQLVEKSLALADRVYAMAHGEIVLQANAREADLQTRLEEAYFGHHVAA